MLPAMELIRRSLRRVAQRVYRPYVLWRIARPSAARIQGHGVLTEPRVFHPVLFFSTRMLIDGLGRVDIAGKRLLDMGTGTGSIGIFAAARGAIVTSCDINVHAVDLARENARRNGVALEVLESDLFSALSGRRFDVICFNLPFYPRAPRTPFEAAFFAGPNFETIRSFAAGCSSALLPEGRIIVVFSEDSGRELILSIFAAGGLVVEQEKIETRLFERHYVVTFRRAPA
jgi:release factor glutamine methyltransferase